MNYFEVLPTDMFDKILYQLLIKQINKLSYTDKYTSNICNRIMNYENFC